MTSIDVNIFPSKSLFLSSSVFECFKNRSITINTAKKNTHTRIMRQTSIVACVGLKEEKDEMMDSITAAPPGASSSSRGGFKMEDMEEMGFQKCTTRAMCFCRTSRTRRK